MAWYDQISRMYDWRDRQVEKAREAGNAARLRRNPDAGPLRPLQLPSRRPRYDLNYQPWQREMVDPNWGGGKFGAPSVTGFNPLLPLSALPGMGYRLPGAALRRLFGRAPRPIRREPSMRFVRPTTDNVVRDYRRLLRPQLGGRGTRFAGRRYGARTTLDDLRKAYE